MKYNQLVASKLKEMRELSHLSIDGAAEILHEHKSTLSKLENGKMNVNVEHLKAYSELLKMPVTSFLPDGTSVVQISHIERHNINSIVNYHHNTIDNSIIDSLKTTIEFLGKVVNGSK
jgi:transcriptional regulator with XRE-family HTH domain